MGALDIFVLSIWTDVFSRKIASAKQFATFPVDVPPEIRGKAVVHPSGIPSSG